MDDATKPNFFLVGAPKCGTSSMADWLRQHPQVFITDRKEPHFFGSDLEAAKYVRDERAYLSLFRGSEGYRHRGEASTWYLYSRRAAREIKAYSPASRILVMLRNPVEVVESLHSHNLYMGSETLRSLEAALDAQAERKLGRRIPASATTADHLFYEDVARFADQLQRYLDAFGRERVHVVVFDDLRADPGGTYREVLRFLEVDPTVEANLRTVNANRQARLPGLRALLRQPALQRVGWRLAPGWAEKLGRALDRFNARPAKRGAMEPHVRARLQASFASDVERLGELLGRDLTAWTTSRSPLASARSSGPRPAGT